MPDTLALVCVVLAFCFIAMCFECALLAIDNRRLRASLEQIQARPKRLDSQDYTGPSYAEVALERLKS